VQGGVAAEHALAAATTLRLTAYGGRRQVGQYLAFPGTAITSSGGVVDLDRDYGGAGLRLIAGAELDARPLVLSVGVDTDAMRERRQGFVNDSGAQGALRRDEDDTVRSADAYAELMWSALPALSVTLGVRTSRVRYASDDRFVTGANPDDSGARTFRNTSPIAGVVWHAAETLNLYASYGQGFETPTFAEMAYRGGGGGLNLALDAATSVSYEIGAKWLPRAGQRINAALFRADTEQEIVVDAATGGRTTYRNAGKTRRRGAEFVWDGELGGGISTHFNYTWLQAQFVDAFASGLPPVAVPAGARLPGVPAQQAFAELAWTPGGWPGFGAGVEVQYVGRVFVNDRNSQFAPAYTIGNARVGFTRAAGGATWTGYLRVNNLADVNYAGSVIVGDTGGRYFEPAPGRNWVGGVSVAVAF